MWTSRGSVAWVVWAVTLGSCASGHNANPSGPVCARYVAKVEACGIAEPGHITCFEPETDRGRCFAQCELRASCAALGEQLCLYEALDDALSDCMGACRQRHVGVDCGGGSDDPICVSCTSGLTIHSTSSLNPEELCDGYTVCRDGSDELGCPTMTCDDGSLTSDHHRCDGKPDCADGSDEDGCAMLICQELVGLGHVWTPWQ